MAEEEGGMEVWRGGDASFWPSTVRPPKLQYSRGTSSKLFDSVGITLAESIVKRQAKELDSLANT